MGFADTFRDFYESLTFSNELHAEAPESDAKAGGGEEGGEENSEDGKEGVRDVSHGEEEGENKDEGGEEEGGDDEEGEEDEEEEEEDDEPVDPKPRLEAECAKTAQCAPLKHHYEDCAERVTRQQEDPGHKGPKEDCVEEFFHLQHCASQCAAPKLFRSLK